MIPSSILIIEDEGLIALRLMELLTKAGYRIFYAASSGDMALEHLTPPSYPDLILMDIGLKTGKLSGIETAITIRQKYEIPIIFLTAYMDEKIEEQMKNISRSDYVIKSFREQGLLAAVEKSLQRKD